MLALVAAESACQRAPLGVALAVPAHAMSARAMPAAARHAVPFDTVRGAPDRWFARDKSLHFGASLVIQLVGYSAARLADARPTAALMGATVLGTSAGIGKEVYDARGHGVPSWRDLA